MGQAIPKSYEEEGLNVVAEPVTNRCDVINAVISNYWKIASLHPHFLKRWLNVDGTVSVRVVFKTIVCLKGLKQATRGAIIEDSQLYNLSVYASVIWLNSNGYIKAHGQPRFIKPFNSYKIDTAYRLTAKGNKVLRDIVREALR